MLKLFRDRDGCEIKLIRASTLALYWYCASKAYQQATGTESPPTEATKIGTRIHNAISVARPLTNAERELESVLKSYMIKVDAGKGSTGLSDTENMVYMRPITRNGKIVGNVVSHGVDDFRIQEDGVVLTEYKTTNTKQIDYYKISTALFQVKVYAWILEPFLKTAGYNIKKCEIIYLKRNGEFIQQFDIYNLPVNQFNILTGCMRQAGFSEEHYNNSLALLRNNTFTLENVESDIERILQQFNDPSKLIAPAKFKCYICKGVFKEQCPLQRNSKN